MIFVNLLWDLFNGFNSTIDNCDFVINLKTGKTFQSGSIDEELMKKSFNL